MTELATVNPRYLTFERTGGNYDAICTLHSRKMVTHFTNIVSPQLAVTFGDVEAEGEMRYGSDQERRFGTHDQSRKIAVGPKT